jgi:hypothetical protein
VQAFVVRLRVVNETGLASEQQEHRKEKQEKDHSKDAAEGLHALLCLDEAPAFKIISPG